MIYCGPITWQLSYRTTAASSSQRWRSTYQHTLEWSWWLVCQLRDQPWSQCESTAVQFGMTLCRVDVALLRCIWSCAEETPVHYTLECWIETKSCMTLTLSSWSAVVTKSAGYFFLGTLCRGEYLTFGLISLPRLIRIPQNVLNQVFKVLSVVSTTIVRGPSVTNSKLVELEHVQHTDLRDGNTEQFGALIGAGTTFDRLQSIPNTRQGWYLRNEQTTVWATVNGNLFRARVFVVNQIFSS